MSSADSNVALSGNVVASALTSFDVRRYRLCLGRELPCSRRSGRQPKRLSGVGEPTVVGDERRHRRNSMGYLGGREVDRVGRAQGSVGIRRRGRAHHRVDLEPVQPGQQNRHRRKASGDARPDDRSREFHLRQRRCDPGCFDAFVEPVGQHLGFGLYADELDQRRGLARLRRNGKARADDLRLVNCLIDRYQAVTNMAVHPSITRDMTEYHSFNEISEVTPSAIIELGFLYEDRDLLENRPDLLAEGVVQGLLCFLEQTVPTPLPELTPWPTLESTPTPLPAPGLS